MEKVKESIRHATEKYNKKSNEPVQLSISMGATVFSEQEHRLQALVEMADKEQYKLKNLKKKMAMEAAALLNH